MEWTSGSRPVAQQKKIEQAETPAEEKAENSLPVAKVKQADTISKENTATETAAADLDSALMEEEVVAQQDSSQLNEDDEIAVAEQPEEETKVPAEAKPEHSGVVYYVIAGCFESPVKADEMARDLQNKGFSDAQVHGKIGRLHRVCYTAFPTRREASNYMLKLQREGYKGVWIQRARW